MDTARTNTPAGYPVRRSATSAWPLCICSFGHRALRASSIVFLSSLSRSLTLARCAKTPIRTEVQDWTTPPARRAPLGEGCFAPVEEVSGNEDLIDILTRIMLYLSKVFDIKNPSFK